MHLTDKCKLPVLHTAELLDQLLSSVLSSCCLRPVNQMQIKLFVTEVDPHFVIS